MRRLYGSGPVHLVALVVSLVVSALAIVRWFDGPNTLLVLVWFAGAIVIHDFVLLPLYSLVDAVGRRRPARSPDTSGRSPGWVYVRVPLLLCALLGLTFVPEIARLGSVSYHTASGSTQNLYLLRYLITCGVLLGGSALAYAYSLLRARRARSGAAPQ